MDKKKRNLLLLSAALVLLVAAAALLYGRLGGGQPQLGGQATDTEQQSGQQNAPQQDADGEADGGEEVSYDAPDFSVENMAGSTVRLSDHFGKPIVLNFWASWCGPCKSEMPAFQSIYEQYGDEVVFLMVNLTDGTQETRESAKSFYENSGYTFPVYLDVNFEAAIAYGVSAIPVTYFIDTEGQLAAYGASALSEEVLLQGLGYILPQA
ncbi:MAG: TlpA family protein disulfide reductase [Oscillospiraceae bacterium]|nr:TlpA family protein disulfide reductase [Oscillospiraceae bacterium]